MPDQAARNDSGAAVECRDLVVRYGDLTAVDGLSFTANYGEVLALLGPNGAGKTSTVETLEGFRTAAGGEVRVLGLDPGADKRKITPNLGVMLQREGIYPVLSPHRVTKLFSKYYEDPEDPDKLLELVGLTSVASTPFRRLSGGEQQRLSLALALVGRPKVLLLDEPSAGVDPEGRVAIRSVIEERRSRGTCIILTTHDLADCERVADRVVIVDHGRAVASGTIEELAESGHEDSFRFAAPTGIDVVSLCYVLELEPGALFEERRGEYRVVGAATPRRVAKLTAWLAENDLPLTDLRTHRRTLEDVYLEVVRRTAADG
ncbi:MAG TPA: ABC transporter ATP-binding protein [Acidimicrobiales bacterium]|nr:ABC transporter ATP-binding protein [Acidimicrobiales bacterium]